MSTSSVVSGTDGVVVPFVGSLFADASGTVGTLETSTVSMTGLDTILEVAVSEENAKKILKGFKIDEIDTGASDTSADVTVSMQNPDDFKAALVAAIGTDNAFYNYLHAQSRAHMVSQLAAGGLADLLEATDLLAYDIAIDASGAAQSMYNAMNDGDAGASRRVIFTQIAKSKIDSYAAAGAVSIDHLPLHKGDVITFVWDATVGEAGTTGGAKITAVASPNAPANAAGTYFNGEQVLISNPTARRVALKITLGSGSGVFTF